eukprot:2374653-Pyramimonas_sp.AAC.1
METPLPEHQRSHRIHRQIRLEGLVEALLVRPLVCSEHIHPQVEPPEAPQMAPAWPPSRSRTFSESRTGLSWLKAQVGGALAAEGTEARGGGEEA